MLRILLCMSCCSVPPASRSATRRMSSNVDLHSKKVDNSISNDSACIDDSIDKSKLEDGKAKLINFEDDINETDQLLSIQANVDDTNKENYGTTKVGEVQGKLRLDLNAFVDKYSTASQTETPDAEDSVAALISVKLQQQKQAPDNIEGSDEDDGDSNLKSIGQTIYIDGDQKFDSATFDNDGAVSPASSNDIEPYRESRLGGNESSESIKDSPEVEESRRLLEQLEQDISGLQPNEARVGQGQESRPLYEPIASTSRNVPSTTKIGDYARIEYSPVDDLDSVTTMSYSRLGSERGASTRSQAGSMLSRQNSLGRATNTNGEGPSRRSSQGGIESTSLSIASQLSNEQFQQNLTNMLESVNSNYPSFGTIGLPLGPPIDIGLTTETTKTSPETPGAALTSASQDSLSDGSFEGDIEISPKFSRSATATSGGALVNDTLQQERVNSAEMAELAKPAPLASGEDEPIDAKLASVVTSSSGAAVKATDDNRELTEGDDSKRVGSPQSINTTTSGALTNPTPTPSEMSTGSGKKKRLKAKALFKKFKTGGKKKNKDEIV